MSNLMETAGFGLVEAHKVGWDTYSLWQRKENRLVYDAAGKQSLMAYLDTAHKLQDRIQKKLGAALPDRYYIWGAGTHTAMLFQLGFVTTENVIAIIDANANLQGRCVTEKEVPVIHPSEIKSEAAILISSKDSEKSIADMICNTLHLSNPIITLYS